MSFDLALKKISDGLVLNEQEMQTAMTFIMEGGASEVQIENFLTGLSKRGETAAEITGAARVLREKALSVKAPAGAVDCCGTGGDHIGTLNISTAVVFVAAACGVPVAKHGNRAASSKSGAADVLEALGVKLTLSKEQLEEALRRFNFCFLMAPQHHQAMKHVSAVRKKIGKRTIFNLLGPLANPASTQYQLLGVFDAKWILPIAQALKSLGTKAAWVVHGTDGLDEITLSGATKIAVLENGTITEKTLTPADFGLPVYKTEDFLGGTAQENAAALHGLLEGRKNAYRDIVLANAAAVLMIAGKAKDLKDGVRLASEAIDSGSALGVLESYAAFTREAAS